MRDYLMKVIKSKETRAKELRDAIKKSEDVNEVRSLGDTLQAVLDELNDAKAQLDEYDKQNKDTDDTEGTNEETDKEEARSNVPTNATRVNGGIIGSFTTRSKDVEDLEYRTAFMNYVQKGTPIPHELRANTTTTTTDAAAAIPQTVVNQIIEKMDTIGALYSRVTKTSYPTGVVVPTSAVKPVATWVAEGKTSDKQKKALGKIVFAAYKLRCEVAMTMETSVMSVSAFEAKLVENVANAMVKAIEEAIIAGDGTTQPEGILNATPSATVTIAGDVPTYAELATIEGNVDEAYETSAVYVMTKKTFMQFESMVDSVGQPIARVNYGLSGKPERYILGREVVCVPYSDAFGDALGFVFDLSDYAINTVYDMGIQRRQDWDTEDIQTKAVESLDGKVLLSDSLVVIKKKTA